VVEDGGLLNPQAAGFELESILAEDEVRGEMQREAEGDEGREEGDPVGQLAAVGSKDHQRRSGQRNEKDQGED
jgi:hypothetical protein